ncbi:hypothetical protein [uncultured Alistipes sp.]
MKKMTLNYSTREINRNFKIKIYGVVDGKKVSGGHNSIVYELLS